MIGDFDTLLVANRGEIAGRIMRTAREMGLRTVAVHSTADARAPHVRAADTAVEIGPPDAGRSYLRAEAIIDAAHRTGAQAVHPGYGFLAENAAFAQACADSGLVFVGPSPRAIADMGDKAAAKRRMRAADVPVVPGYDGDDQDDERLIAEAGRVGFPLMVKAAAGGGGKGMRLVRDAAALPAALAGARRESLSAFGSDVLLLERAIVRPRHVEIQILADTHGHVIHLGERDCSVQRRHQKVLEEAPSPAVDAALRARMGAAGVAAARAVGYVGAGTIEFLLEERDGEPSAYFFLEMNTRLQVEHPVTEMVTGLDLVEWQLRIARGEHLSITQEDVTLSGHAIEARLYAEDPANGYLPATGTVHGWRPASGRGIRCDAGVEQGSEITSHYDPMIAKLIAYGADREQARVRLLRTLEDTTVLGPVTNRSMLAATLRVPAFVAGEVTTAFLDDHAPALPAITSRHVAALAAWRYAVQREVADALAPGLSGWSSGGVLESVQRLHVGEETYSVTVSERATGVTIHVDDVAHVVVPDGVAPVVDGVPVPIAVVQAGSGRILAAFRNLDVEALDLATAPSGPVDAGGAGVLSAPMHGMVISADVAVGQSVVVGQRLVTLEAMKMEHEIVADVNGVVEEITRAGSQVAADQVLVRIAADGGAG